MFIYGTTFEEKVCKIFEVIIHSGSKLLKVGSKSSINNYNILLYNILY